MQVTVEYGQFRLRLHAHSSVAQSRLQDFLEHGPAGLTTCSGGTDWNLTLVTADAGLAEADRLEAGALDNRTWTLLWHAWTGLESTWTGSSLLRVDTGGVGNPATNFAFLISARLAPLEIRALLSSYLVFLRRRWLAEKGALLIHASAVARGNRGFLFLGESGAGKTTVATLRDAVAHSVLHDDKVVIRRSDAGYAIAGTQGAIDQTSGVEGSAVDSWPVATTGLEANHAVPLCAFFTLKQDERDWLVPLSDLQGAKALVIGYLEVSGHLGMSTRAIRKSVHVLADVARHAPCFELHFRRSPDFWKLIDEQFAR